MRGSFLRKAIKVLWTQGFCILLVLQLCSLTSQVYGDEDLSDDLPENVLFKDFADPSISENEQNDIKTNDSELVPPTLESSTSLLDANISDSHVKSLDAVLRNSTERIPQHSSNIFKNETFENVTDLSVIDKSSASAVVPNQSTTRLSSQKPTLKPPVGGSTKPGQTIQMTTILPNHNDTGPQNSSKFEGPEEYQFTTAIIVGIACGSAAFVVLLVAIAVYVYRRTRPREPTKQNYSTFWDDNITLSYINGHIDALKDTSDDLNSLDNDSFLNSLDSVSYTNLWTTENSRHTKF